MDDRITIIEGPPPVFESTDDAWAVSLSEGVQYFGTSLTRLRTFNGPALVERCHRAWAKKLPIFLHYRNRLGMEEKAPILAARTAEVDGGQVLYLWIRRPQSEDEEDDSGDDSLD